MGLVLVELGLSSDETVEVEKRHSANPVNDTGLNATEDRIHIPIGEGPETKDIPIIEKTQILGQLKVQLKQRVIGYYGDSELIRYYVDPEEATIKLGDMVMWVSGDEARHRISCYQYGYREFITEDIFPDEPQEHRFEVSGEYLCVDAIYGARAHITVK